MNGIGKSFPLTVTTLSGRFPYAVMSDAHRYSKLEQTSPSLPSPHLTSHRDHDRSFSKLSSHEFETWATRNNRVGENQCREGKGEGSSAPILNMHCASNSMICINLSDNVQTVGVTLLPISIFVPVVALCEDYFLSTGNTMLPWLLFKRGMG